MFTTSLNIWQPLWNKPNTVSNFLSLFWEKELLGNLSSRPQANHRSHKHGWLDKFRHQECRCWMFLRSLEVEQRAITWGCCPVCSFMAHFKRWSYRAAAASKSTPFTHLCVRTINKNLSWRGKTNKVQLCQYPHEKLCILSSIIILDLCHQCPSIL